MSVAPLLLSAVLLAANAFFVAAEFALTAARPHRLAAEDGRASRAALAGTRELSMMLAGAQLGITLCSLGLGALAEPALAHLLDPLLHAVGLPSAVSYGVAFVLALAVVTVLHIVVGEMAPKSWAISHPERSARALALPFRGYAWLVRPALRVLGGAANAVLRLLRVTPVDALDTARGPAELRALLRESTDAGLLPAAQHRVLDGMLALRSVPVSAVLVPAADMVTVPAAATGDDVVAAYLRTGRSRFPVVAPPAPTAPVTGAAGAGPVGDGMLGVVHVRDAVRAAGGSAATLAAPALRLPPDADAYGALRAMQDGRGHLALVVADGTVLGLVTLEDLVERLIGAFDDETDRPAA